MKKLLGLLGAVGLAASGGSVLVACGNGNTKPCECEIKVEEIKNQVAYAIGTENKSLAEIRTKLDKLVITGVKKITAELAKDSKTDVTFTISVADGYKIDNTKFVLEGVITGEVPVEKEINNDAINLGSLEAAPTEDVIKQAVIGKNEGLTAADLDVAIGKDNSATVTAKNDWKGQVVVSWTFKKEINNDAINLGSLEAAPTEDVIKQAVIGKNEGLTVADLDVTIGKDNSATVTAKNDWKGQVVVSWTFKKEINNDAINLGSLEAAPTEDVIKQAVIGKNEGLTAADLDVTIGKDNSATVTAKNDWKGQVVVSWTFKKEINNDAINLGSLEAAPTEDVIKQAVIDKNEGLTAADLDVTIGKDNSATVTAKNDWKGQVVVSWTFKKEINNDAINLGSLEAAPTEDVIKQAVIGKNEGLTAADLDVAIGKDNSATVTAKNDWKGQVVVSWTLKKEINNEAINLGSLEAAPTEDVIKQAVIGKNEGLTVADLDVTIGKDNSATVTAKNDWKGQVVVSWTFKKEINNDAINLGSLEAAPTEDVIKQAVIGKNEGLTVADLDVTIGKDNSATVTAKNDWKGQVVVSWTFKKEINNDAINLGSLEAAPTEDVIKQAVIGKNEGLTVADLDVTIGKDNSATVTAKNDWKGQVVVSWTFKKEINNDAINLGSLEAAPTEDVIKQAVIDKNEGLTAADLDVAIGKDNSATVTAKNDWKGQVVVSWTLRTEISNEAINLGSLEAAPTEDVIKQAVIGKNEGLTAADLDVAIGKDNSATVTAKNDWKGQVVVSWTFKKEINNDAINLGSLEAAPTEDVIKQAVIDKNEGLTAADLDVTIGKDNSATVTAKNDWKGQVVVSWTFKKEINNDAINLGSLEAAPTEDVIKQAVIDKNEGLTVADLDVAIGKDNSATVTAKNDWKGQVVVSWTLKTEISNEAINLGSLEAAPTEDVIKQAVIDKNEGLTVADLDVAIGKDNSATVTAKNDWKGQVVVSWTLKTEINNDAINLGSLEAAPTEDVIKQAVIDKNEGLTAADLDVAIGKDNSATVTAKNDWKGQVVVS